MSGRLMGIDPGERRVGVALSDELGFLASPLCILERRSWAVDVAKLAELVSTHDVSEIVVGHPKTLRGEIGPQARRAERFAKELGGAVSVPVRLWDERYSTAEATELLSHARKRPAGRGRAPVRVDAVAAAVILQGFLDARRSSESSSS